MRDGALVVGVGVVVMTGLLAGCSSGTSTQGNASAASNGSGTSGSKPAASDSATWNGLVTGSDQMKIGTDNAHAADCSGTPSVPTATVETTEGWKVVTTSPANGFGAGPAGKSVTLAESTKRGPIWNSATFSMMFSRDEQVGSETWKLWLGKVSCLGG